MQAAEAETTVLDLLKTQPTMRTVDLIQATGSKPNTMSERLRRMASRGQIVAAAEGGWSLPTPTL
jgi:hypothetical protein